MLQQGLNHFHVPILTGSQQGSAPILQGINTLESVQAPIYQAGAPHIVRALEKTFPVDDKELTFPLLSLSLYNHDRVHPKDIIVLYMWMTCLR